MAAAYHTFCDGVTRAVTKTGKTNPEIRKNTPHGPGNASQDLAISKTPGKVSTVTGK